jgi:hypothetical protein
MRELGPAHPSAPLSRRQSSIPLRRVARAETSSFRMIASTRERQFKMSIGSRFFAIHDSLLGIARRCHWDLPPNHRDIRQSRDDHQFYAADTPERRARITSPLGTLAAHRSQSIMVSTRRRPRMMPSASCAQLPEPRTFTSPGRTWSTQPGFAQKIDSNSARCAAVIGARNVRDPGST